MIRKANIYRADMNSSLETERRIGLFGATGIGVGAIVGGGILALAGTALATTGPSTILAFGINGVIALLTALSFAEMASKFTESGGTYNFSKKVLSVETAFMVGWVVWFASIVAAVLYAVGFAHFAMVMTSDVLHLTMRDPPAWITSSRAITAVAVSTTLLLTIYLMRTAAGGGQLVNIGKVVVFGILIIGGLWMLPQQPAVETMGAFKPFLTAGVGGLLQAMGYTFIAFQGFDLIAAVGGEVREPSKTLPRAMIFSLAIALAIYLPLLFVITSLGTPPGQAINIAAAEHPESIIAIAAQCYLGPLGYWLVIVAAILFDVFCPAGESVCRLSDCAGHGTGPHITIVPGSGACQSRYARCRHRDHFAIGRRAPAGGVGRGHGGRGIEFDFSDFICVGPLDCNFGTSQKRKTPTAVSRSTVPSCACRGWPVVYRTGDFSGDRGSIRRFHYRHLVRCWRHPVPGIVCQASASGRRVQRGV